MDTLLFLNSPVPFLQVWSQVILPALATLLPRSIRASIFVERICNQGPIALALLLLQQFLQKFVFLLQPETCC